MENGNANAPAAPTAQVAQSTDAPAEGTNSTPSLIKDAATEAARKHKLKIEGREVEVDDDELKRGYSHQKAANKVFQEGKQALKKAEKFIEMMKDKTTLFNTLKELGHDPRALSEEYLSSVLEEEMLDPKERETRTYKKRLAQYEEKEKKEKESEENKIREQLKTKYAKEYSDQFVNALKTTGLPPTKETVAKVAGYIKKATLLKFEMTPLEAAKLVREDTESTHKSIYSNAETEHLVKLIGEEGLKKIRAYDMAKLRDPSSNLKTPTEQSEGGRKRDPGAKRMTPAEWRAFNRK